MARLLRVAAAQMGPIHLASQRADILARIVALLQAAADKGAQLVVLPEIALATFFPRYPLQDVPQADAEFFDDGRTLLTSPRTRPVFDAARRLGLDVCLGFAERDSTGGGGGDDSGGGGDRRYNACVYYSAAADTILARYRKIHLPGTLEAFDGADAVNQLEKLWFTRGDLGFNAFRAPGLLSDDPEPVKAAKAANGVNGVNRVNGTSGTNGTSTARRDPVFGMMICNDRRWAESWRCYGLQGVEVVLCGFNTTAWAPDLCGKPGMQTFAESEDESVFQHRLVTTANSYMNSCFSVSAGKAGLEDGKYALIRGSMIVSPDGYVVAEAQTKDDEVVYAEIDLDECVPGKAMMFNFDRHRQIDCYGRITAQCGVTEPELLTQG